MQLIIAEPDSRLEQLRRLEEWLSHLTVWQQHLLAMPFAFVGAGITVWLNSVPPPLDPNLLFPVRPSVRKCGCALATIVSVLVALGFFRDALAFETGSSLAKRLLVATETSIQPSSCGTIPRRMRRCTASRRYSLLRKIDSESPSS